MPFGVPATDLNNRPKSLANNFQLPTSRFNRSKIGAMSSGVNPCLSARTLLAVASTILGKPELTSICRIIKFGGRRVYPMNPSLYSLVRDTQSPKKRMHLISAAVEITLMSLSSMKTRLWSKLCFDSRLE